MSNVIRSKTLNSSRNVIFGFALKLYQVFMPFIIRTIIIYILGMEYAGLNSLFTSLLSILNIAELGVGTIIVFYMYQPIEENDTSKICALMKLYKNYYRIIGGLILIIGIMLTPFLDNLVNGDIPKAINIYYLYFFNLGATVLSYWLFAYKSALFLAHQRNDIVSKVTIITDTIKYVLQISLLWVLHNYYYYVLVLLFIQILNNVLIAIKANKTYPMYKPNGVISERERRKINTSICDVFYGQLGMKVTLSVDSIIISTFLGLIPLAQYQNYYYIVNAIISFFTIFFQSLRASIGTNIIVKSKDNNYVDFKFITFLITGALSFCVSCLLNMFQPFIKLWVGQSNLLDFGFVVLLIIYFVVYELTILIGCYKDISGKWHEDRFRPLITAVTNLIINIILVKYMGLYGILLSTIISFIFINIPWLYHRIFIDVFETKNKKNYFIYLIHKILIIFIIAVMSFFICNILPLNSSIIKLIVNFIVCVVTTIILFYIFNKKDPAMKRLVQLIKKFNKVMK